MKEIFKTFKSSPRYTIKWDNYFNIYQNLLKKFVNKKITFVEVGVGNGGSLFMWKSFLGKKANIIGIELNPEAKKLERYGFKIFIGDQSDAKFWKTFYKKIGKIDVLVDDGGHRNIQQITSVMETLNNIKYGGKIIIEDTHTSYMRKKGFKNPSRFSLINFCHHLIENLHRRNPMIDKDLNNISKRIYSIFFYDSLVSLNFADKKINRKTKLLENNKSLRNYFVDYRHKGNFIKTLRNAEKKFGKINENSLFYKIIRKFFHRNIFISLNEKYKILKYINQIKK